MKKLGLYIVNYMYRDYLPFCLNSLIRQSKKPDYVVFIDDCSKDDSLKVLEYYLDKFKIDKIIINQDNLGTVKTVNKAVNHLIENGCDYFCGISTDDVFDRDYLKKTYDLLSKSDKDVGFVYTWVRRVGLENKIDAHPDFDAELLMRKPYIHGSSMIKKECWQSVGGLPEADKEEDWAMYRKMAGLGWKGLVIKEPLLLWRKHATTRTLYGNKSGEVRLNKFKEEKI